jgi:hypothetical protein
MYFLSFSTTAIAIASILAAFATPAKAMPGANRTPTMFDCPGVDHHFLHQRFWIQASSKNNCMTLERDPNVIIWLKTIAQPRPKGYRRYYTLICSAEAGACSWGYSPLSKYRPYKSTNAAGAGDDGASVLT